MSRARVRVRVCVWSSETQGNVSLEISSVTSSFVWSEPTATFIPDFIADRTQPQEFLKVQLTFFYFHNLLSGLELILPRFSTMEFGNLFCRLNNAFNLQCEIHCDTLRRSDSSSLKVESAIRI